MIKTLMGFCETLDQITIYDLFRYTREEYKAKKCYREIFLEKKYGGYRILHAPRGKLKIIQYEVLRYLQEAEISPAAYAYVKGKRLIDHANCHLKQKTLVKLDIEDFFDSVTFPQVYHAIDIALTRSPLTDELNNELSWFFTKFCTLAGSLPQGAPTSPLLSNMIFLPLDRMISSYCAKRGICYTRYSDDMIFSGDIHVAALIDFVKRLLEENGFLLNVEKIVVAKEGRKKKVTGVVVNERLQADRQYRRDIRQEMYYIAKFGLEEHLTAKGLLDKEQPMELPTQRSAELSRKKKPTKGKGGFRKRAFMIKELQRLLGKINYILQLDPQNMEFQQYRTECKNLLSSAPNWLTN